MRNDRETISRISNISDFRFQKRDSSGRIPWGFLADLLGVCLGFAWGVMSQCLWIYVTFLLGDEFFERGMWFSGSCLLGDVDFGTSFAWGFAWVCETEGCKLDDDLLQGSSRSIETGIFGNHENHTQV